MAGEEFYAYMLSQLTDADKAQLLFSAASDASVEAFRNCILDSNRVFKPCKVNLNTRHVGALYPNTYQSSPSIPRSRPGLLALAYNAPLTPAAAVQ